MAIFSIMVTGAPYDSQVSVQAYRFCEAALKNQHQIAQVFFYQQGVSNANRLLYPQANEFNSLDAWASLSTQYAVPLKVCITASSRRGVVDATEANNLGLPSHNLDDAFEQVGMADFFSQIQQQPDIITVQF